jgi:hypothetical protein
MRNLFVREARTVLHELGHAEGEDEGDDGEENHWVLDEAEG